MSKMFAKIKRGILFCAGAAFFFCAQAVMSPSAHAETYTFKYLIFRSITPDLGNKLASVKLLCSVYKEPDQKVLLKTEIGQTITIPKNQSQRPFYTYGTQKTLQITTNEPGKSYICQVKGFLEGSGRDVALTSDTYIDTSQSIITKKGNF